ncbi:hypothetical protein Tco_0114916 [Tanacetum coccineum]
MRGKGEGAGGGGETGNTEKKREEEREEEREGKTGAGIREREVKGGVEQVDERGGDSKKMRRGIENRKERRDKGIGVPFLEEEERVRELKAYKLQFDVYNSNDVLPEEQVVTRVSAARVIYAVNTAEINEINTASIVRYRTKCDLVLGWIKGIVTTVSFKKEVTTVIVDYYC